MIIDLGCGPEREYWISADLRLDLNVGDEPDDNLYNFDMRTETLPVSDNTVDEIYCRYSLRFMYDEVTGLVDIFREMARALKPLGRITIIDWPEVFDPEQGDYYEVDYKVVQSTMLLALAMVKNLQLQTEIVGDDGFLWIIQKGE